MIRTHIVPVNLTGLTLKPIRFLIQWSALKGLCSRNKCLFGVSAEHYGINFDLDTLAIREIQYVEVEKLKVTLKTVSIPKSVYSCGQLNSFLDFIQKSLLKA